VAEVDGERAEPLGDGARIWAKDGADGVDGTVVRAEAAVLVTHDSATPLDNAYIRCAPGLGILHVDWLGACATAQGAAQGTVPRTRPAAAASREGDRAGAMACERGDGRRNVLSASVSYCLLHFPDAPSPPLKYRVQANSKIQDHIQDTAAACFPPFLLYITGPGWLPGHRCP
jgi:hypothetical protein